MSNKSPGVVGNKDVPAISGVRGENHCIPEQTFDPVERKKIISKAMSVINEEAPACFMWRHQLLYGMAKGIDYTPPPDARIYGTEIKVK